MITAHEEAQGTVKIMGESAKTRAARLASYDDARAIRARRRSDKKSKFLMHLIEHGNVLHACQETPVSRHWIYFEKTKDPVFAADWELALEAAIQNLEHEAYRRAVKGVDEPVYHQGEQVDTVKRFSDTLLIFLLKARRPKVYRERIDVNHGGKVEIQQLRIYLPSNGREVQPEVVQGTVIKELEKPK